MRRVVLAAIGAALVLAPAGIATTEATAATAAAHVAAAGWPIVKPGAKGNTVRTIQYLLKQRGIRVVVDGIFGKSTTTAVKSFQRANRLVVDGHVGPLTWQKLVLPVKLGSRGDAVRAAQNELRNQWGYKRVAVDGTFGSATQTAVKSFQTKRTLKADGIVGQATWEELTR
jgi:peptidoglycan hydrolase-like protein with peptidoglycan-binding domain